jgi:hypothetical protein
MDMLGDIQTLTGQLQRVREASSSLQCNDSTLAMTLITGQLWHDQPGYETDVSVALAAWQAFLEHIKMKGELPPSSDTSGHMLPNAQAAVEYMHALRRCMMWRRFFTTSAGQMNTGPKALRTGDLVVILPGSRIPFALRRKRKNYTMIGQVYVYGVMDGEVLDKDFQPPPQWVTFNIE